MKFSRCKLTLSTDSSGDPIVDFISKTAREQAPLFAWAEPDLTAVALNSATGRREDFKPLTRGVPDWPPDLPLVEARLFWEKSALHVVAIANGCQWATIKEEAGEQVRRSSWPVCTLRDRQRFGLGENASGIDTLWLIEYWRKGRLVAWRLAEGNA